ncbi:MAG: thioredoxin domain-containing protein [Christensenellales bacterium]|jgi:uncharacterized protein YyaL (SSP411 family)
MKDQQPNQLIHETSPYLLQHAYNPVDWYPWGEEAFAKAKKEDKPVFLSIGYSSCHWCHVMERESFEDVQVAELLAQHYVSVKVDREERSDIDNIYMSACQAFTGQGGWPLTLFLTPDQKPFFAGTYFPKHGAMGRPGLVDLLTNIASMWNTKREKLYELSRAMMDALQHDPKHPGHDEPQIKIISRTFAFLSRQFDPAFGGFSQAPKFPSPHNLLFLQQYYALKGDEQALHMMEKTLMQMYRGGLFDHIGYGFSRYATDKRWLIPHFEKMLYDNALLTYAYLQAYQLTNKQIFLDIAQKTLHYISREMTSPQGGFYTAQDADSEGEEGLFYLFDYQEAIDVLKEEQGESFNRFYDITRRGNFEGKNIPNLLSNPSDAPDAFIDALRQKMKAYRKQRVHLHTDDKLITSNNAMMITAYAKAYQLTQHAEYLHTAKKAFARIEKDLTDASGRLQATCREHKPSGKGFLDDYAYCIWACLELYETEYDLIWLQKAFDLAKQMHELFWDEQQGGFFYTGHDQEKLIIRPKEFFDHAVPCGNSVAAYVLQKLSRMSAKPEWNALSEQQTAVCTTQAAAFAAGHSFFDMALTLVCYPAVDLVCVLPKDSKPLRETLGTHLYPNLCMLVKTPENAESLSRLAPFTQSYEVYNDAPTYYLCRNQTCSAPFNGAAELKKRLDALFHQD